MKKILRLTYNDGKEVNLILMEKEIPIFIEKMRKNEPYWDENQQSAFGTSIEGIRYWNIFDVKEEELKEKSEESKSEATVITPDVKEETNE